jgi:hypothetical protein
VATLSAIYGFKQAKQQTRVATSRQLAAQALVDLDVRAPHKLLLALESMAITQQIDPLSTVASRQLLNAVLNATGGMPRHHRPLIGAVLPLRQSPDGPAVFIRTQQVHDPRACRSKNRVILMDMGGRHDVPL